MLELVDAIEQYGGQVGGFLAHQVAQDVEPLPLSASMERDPVLVVLFPMAAFECFFLEGHVHGQFPGVEAWQGIEPVVKGLGVTGEPQMPPWHPPRNDVSRDGWRGKGQGEVQYGGLETLPVDHGPDRFAGHVAGIRHPELASFGAILIAQEVEDAVVSGTAAGHERRPRRRRQRRNHRGEFPARAGSEQAFEKGHDALFDQRIENREGCSIQSDQQGARAHRATSAGTASRWLWMKLTSSPIRMSLTSRWASSAKSRGNGNCR